jgi:hypothetical protein
MLRNLLPNSLAGAVAGNWASANASRPSVAWTGRRLIAAASGATAAFLRRLSGNS